MSPYGAVSWLNVLKETLNEKEQTSQIIAINFAIQSIKEKLALETDVEEWRELFELMKQDPEFVALAKGKKWAKQAKEMGLDI